MSKNSQTKKLKLKEQGITPKNKALISKIRDAKKAVALIENRNWEGLNKLICLKDHLKILY
jgi:hypothetical protein